MSLAAWNQPSIISAAGGATGVILSVLQKTSPNLPFVYISLLQGVAYSINVYATSQPGRLDGQKSISDKKNEDAFDPMNDSSLLVPSPWAFAIWGPIFLGELLYCVASFFANDNETSALVRSTAPGFIASQLFQSLWAASFRPKYYESKALWHRFVSTAMLSCIALSLNQSHQAIASTELPGGVLSYVLYGLPLALHFGWTTAASLVNLNGSLAASKCSDTTMMAAGHASAVAATVIGATVSLTRQAPVFGLVIAWALSACASSNATQKNLPQKWLCAGGAVVSASAALLACVRRSR